jgi:hypothetical protein
MSFRLHFVYEPGGLLARATPRHLPSTDCEPDSHRERENLDNNTVTIEIRIETYYGQLN